MCRLYSPGTGHASCPYVFIWVLLEHIFDGTAARETLSGSSEPMIHFFFRISVQCKTRHVQTSMHITILCRSRSHAKVDGELGILYILDIQ